MGGGIGNGLIIAGLLLVGIGVLVKVGWMGWFGHLPGDLRFKNEHFSIYLPITTMIVLSILLSLLINLIRKL